MLRIGSLCLIERHSTAPDLPDALDATGPDAVLDVIPYTEAQAEILTSLCADRTDRLAIRSSGDVYRQYDGLRGALDHAPDPVPLGEDAPLRSSCYPYRGADTDFTHADDYDKILVEEQVRAAEVPRTILRLSKVYGPHDDEHHVVECQLSFLICQRDLKTQFIARHFERSREISPNLPACFWEVPRPRSERPA